MPRRRIVVLASLAILLALLASGCSRWVAFNERFDANFVRGALMQTAMDPSLGAPDLASADHRSENLGTGPQESVSAGGGSCPT
jgi:hypothetical protein